MATVACSRSSINGDDTIAVPRKILHECGVRLLQTTTRTDSGATAVGEEVHDVNISLNIFVEFLSP